MEGNTKKDNNIKNNINIIKRLVIFTEILVLFLVIGSSIAMAYAGFSEENRPISVPTDYIFIQKDGVYQTEFSPKVGLASENPKFIKYRNNKFIYKPAHSSIGYKSGFSPSLVDLSHLKHTSVADLYASASTSIPTSFDLRTLNRVTPVKNKNEAGVCWTFATYGSHESYLMPGGVWSFSANNIKNLLSSANAHNCFDRDINDGGDFLMSTTRPSCT
jgi:C1A family cysteine protease